MVQPRRRHAAEESRQCPHDPGDSVALRTAPAADRGAREVTFRAAFDRMNVNAKTAGERVHNPRNPAAGRCAPRSGMVRSADWFAFFYHGS